MRAEDHGIWAITSYYNPLRYRRRLENFHRFRAALDLPLALVELGFNGCYDLGAGDADVYLPVGDGDILWQKERLLNLALKQLPANCTHVAWIDCDLIAKGGWTRALSEALTVAPLVQAYRRVNYLTRAGDVERVAEGAVARISGGVAPDAVLGGVTNRTGRAATPGMAWAARRDMLAHHGLYDGCIIGGGDTAMACAAFGNFDTVTVLHRMNAEQIRRYLDWAVPFHRTFGGAIGITDLDVQHLWHGDLADRHAGERHIELAKHGFDPCRDIALGKEGAWRWASDKPELHQLLERYFRARRDDGVWSASELPPSQPAALGHRDQAQ